jgi:hypothetical protein
VTVKQLFETYVYAQILSSTDLLPFVIQPINSAHASLTLLHEQRAAREKKMGTGTHAESVPPDGALSA